MSASKKNNESPKITCQGYSYGFKINNVEEIEYGQISIRQVAKKYGVSSFGNEKWK